LFPIVDEERAVPMIFMPIPLPGDDLLAGDDTDLHAVATFPDVSYG